MSTPALAVLGAPPRFTEPVHVGRPALPNRRKFLDRMEGVLDRAWLTNNGPLVLELEAKLAAFFGVHHCVAVSNATVGLELAIRALELRGEIIMPSYTFVATAHAAYWHGIRPVFCDIEPRHHQMAVEQIEGLITPETTAIMSVHLWGLTADLEGIEALARRRKLKILYDAAHAFGCSHRGRRIGGFGDAEVFSFHATKVFNTFEGGAITTNDDALAAKLRLMRNFGFAGYDNVVSAGTNAKMSEASAAMGLTLFDDVEAIFTHNRLNHVTYAQRLGQLPGVRVLHDADVRATNCQYVVIEIDAERFGLTRDELKATLDAENVLARRYFFPGCHRMEPYRQMPLARPLPVTEALCDRVLCLPTGPGVPRSTVEAMADLIAAAHGASGLVRRALASR